MYSTKQKCTAKRQKTFAITLKTCNSKKCAKTRKSLYHNRLAFSFLNFEKFVRLVLALLSYNIDRRLESRGNLALRRIFDSRIWTAPLWAPTTMRDLQWRRTVTRLARPKPRFSRRKQKRYRR